MIKRMIVLFFTIAMFAASVGFADTLPQFMFKTTASMSVRQGEPSLLISPGAEKLLDGGYELELTVTERGGVDATIDRILVHVFDSDQETNTFESTISHLTVGAGQTINLKERLNVRSGQWVGYEMIAGERRFYSLCQCGVNEVTTEPSVSESAPMSTEESVSSETSEPVIASEPADVIEDTSSEEQAAEIAVITSEKSDE